MTDMIYRNLGNTGLKVSVLGYGVATFSTQVDEDAAVEIIRTAFEAGVNFFDAAEVYGQGKSEEVLGAALKRLNYPRTDYILSTKVYFGTEFNTIAPTGRGLSRKHIIEGVRASLKRLQQDYVDVVLAHRPDPETPIEETVRAFNWLIDQGLTFYWGTSEWSPEQLTEAWEVADRLGLVGPAAEQPEYNLLHRANVEKDLVPLYERRGLGLTTWSPLSFGVLTGKYAGSKIPEDSRLAIPLYEPWRSRINPRSLAAVDALGPIAAELGTDTTKLSIAWAAANPRVSTVLTGSSKLQQLKDNLAALHIIPKLTPEVLKRIDAVMEGVEY